MSELYIPEYGKAPQAPTQDAYDAACRALSELRAKFTALADLWESHDDRPAIHPAAIAVRAVLAGDMDPRPGDGWSR